MTQFSESINAVDKLSKNIDKLSDIYILTHDKKYSIISTQQPLRKYISNLKRRNKNLTPNLKTIIDNDYTFILLERFKHQTKSELNYRMNELKILHEKTFIPVDKKYTRELYKKSLPYEYQVLDLLKTHFINSNIVRSTNNFSKYDFCDLNTGYFFELKTNTYSINSYPTAVLNIKKISYPHLIFIFGYNENYYDVLSQKFKTKVNFYYIFYDEKRFNEYNKRYVITQATGKSELVYDIPTSDLNEIHNDTIIELESKIASIDKYLKIYDFVIDN